LRAHATAEHEGKLLRSDRLVLGVAAVKGFHREGLPQDNGNALLRTAVGEPLPGQQTLDGPDDPLAVRRDGLENGCRSGLHVTAQEDCSRLMHDADVQAPRVEINTTIKWVRLHGEAPEILCRGTRRTRAAGVKLLHTSANPIG
jgi:hypothetical protein